MKIYPEIKLSLVAPKDPVYAYIAGFMDGDGHFGLHKDQININASQVRLAPLEFIKKHFACSILKSIREKESNRQTAYQLNILNEDKKKFLTKILPYLVLKKEQAKILLEAIKLKENKINGLGGSFTLQEEIILVNFEIRIKKLNAKGIKAIQQKENKMVDWDTFIKSINQFKEINEKIVSELVEK